MTGQDLFVALDLAGTYAFASSGALAAQERRLDLYGVAAAAYVVACGGGIVRDLCLGGIPPVGLSDWRYLTAAMIAAAVTVVSAPLVKRLAHPVLLFDALGLGFFAVSGAQKALAVSHNAELAVLVGMATAVGGGVIRDVLLNRVPVILKREIYASAALVAAVIVVIGDRLFGWTAWVPWVAIVACSALRLLSLYYHWHLPRIRKPG